MSHPGICHCYDFLQDSINFYIILELGCPRTLADLIAQKRISESEQKAAFRGIAEAVSYIHKMNVAHRDIKPENVLVDNEYRVKLIDFGLACYNDANLISGAGSLYYQAPEILHKRPFDGKVADIWALGVLLYTMMFGRQPWTRRMDREVARQIREGEFCVPVDTPAPLKDLICGMMETDVRTRMTIDEVLTSYWLASVVPRYSSTPSHLEPLTTERVDALLEDETGKEEDASSTDVRQMLRLANRRKSSAKPSRIRGPLSASSNLVLTPMHSVERFVIRDCNCGEDLKG
jgi:serine/threonine protein kinase